LAAETFAYTSSELRASAEVTTATPTAATALKTCVVDNPIQIKLRDPITQLALRKLRVLMQ
jgi:hypothetical protein